MSYNSHFQLQQIFSKGFHPSSALITSVIFHGLNSPKVQTLIDARANMEQSTETGSTALLVACRRGHRDITSFLLQAKANADWSLGLSPLVSYWSSNQILERSRCSRMQLLAAITPFCQSVHGPRMYKNLVGVLMFQISFSSLI